MLVTTLPLLSLAFCMFALYRLFGIYRQGQYFSLGAARQLNLAAAGFLLWAIADIVCEPVLTYLLKLPLPKAKRIISHGYSTGHGVALLLSYALVVARGETHLTRNSCSFRLC
ncbi:hypothetical protein [Sodalis glossinidius]|nr:hypothetical protein [Sodalis glossinidius]